MAKELSKNTEKSKQTYFATIKNGDINITNFDDSEQENPSENVNEEDNSQKEISRKERNDITNDTPFITPRKIHYEILKTNKGYKIINATKDTKIIEKIQEYLDSFPKFIKLTKEKIEGCFVGDSKKTDIFKINKTLNPYHNVMFPNGDIIPLSNFKKSDGPPTKKIKEYREYRYLMRSLKKYFDDFKKYFKSKELDYISDHPENKYEFILYILIKKSKISNNNKLHTKLKENEYVQTELDEIYNYIKGDK